MSLVSGARDRQVSGRLTIALSAFGCRGGPSHIRYAPCEPGGTVAAAGFGSVSTDPVRMTGIARITSCIPTVLCHPDMILHMDETLTRELLADHSRNPRNYGRLTDPDAEHETSNPQCVGPTHPEGDEITLTLELSDETSPVIEAAQFTGCGCTLSQATASLLTEQMIGTPVDEVVEWDSGTLENLVGMDLTPSRLKCAELALVGVRHAVENR